MNESVTAGLKWDPLMRALKISSMKKPHNRPTWSKPAYQHEFHKAARSRVPRNSKRRIRSDSLNVVRKSDI